MRRSTRVTVVAAVGFLLALPFAALAVGNDPGLAQQWGIRQIGAHVAWDRGVLGAGATVAVIDTGIDAGHEDLRGQIAATVSCVNTGGEPGRCMVGGSDIQGHGTHVAGTAAAASNNVGVAGVAPEAKIVAVGVFQEFTDELTGEKSFGAYTEDINAALRWVVANVKTKGSINLSLGGDFADVTLRGTGFERGIEDAWKAGWVPVLASGNENLFGAGVAGSSNYGALNAMVVGATGPDDELARYSSPFGSAKWGIVAPGGNARGGCQEQPERCVLSTFNGGQYGFLQGTSMATPHVAGAAALLMGRGLTNAQTVQRLLDSANKTVACGSGCKGRLDVAKASAGLGPAPAPAPGAAPAAGQAPAPAASSPSPPPSSSTTASSRPTAPTSSSRAPVAGATTIRPPDEAPPAEVPLEVPAAPEIAEPIEEPPASDGLTGLSIEAAQSAVEESTEQPGLATGVVATGALALAGAAAAVVLGWRRRWFSAVTAGGGR